MTTMPRHRQLDSTLQLWRDPYGYIARQCAKFDTDVFEARIMLQPTLCMTGPEAARLFYDPQRFERRHAAPEPVQATLFGKGGVQGLDGAVHRHRKALFTQTLNAQRVDALATETRQEWEACFRGWAPGSSHDLYELAQDVLVRAVFRWAGIALPEKAAVQRRQELVSLFDDAARGIVPHVRSRMARRRLESWIEAIIGSVRSGRTPCVADTILHHVAGYQDENGEILAPRIAAVELLNVLRPVVAVSVYLVWCAHALACYPYARRDLDTPAGQEYLHGFVQEIRRYYPFFPVLAARVRDHFEWKDVYFHKGQRVLLDLYGTNHDPRTWHDPARFNPERFRDACPGQFELVPQGGGDPRLHHRCPGEDVTLALMKVFTGFLVNRPSCTVVSEDFQINKNRLPALPCSPLLLKV